MTNTLFRIIFASCFGLSMAQYYNQSAPFFLVVSSSNATIDGSVLAACHEGAAIEGLCLGGKYANITTPSYSQQYQFNTSDTQSVADPTQGVSGIVTFSLPVGDFNVSSGLGLSYNPTSNVAIPLFQPGSGFATQMNFDSNDCLNIQGYNDDTIVPANTGATTAYYRWYICQTYWGYTYITLAWVLGEYPPQNPTCQSVRVQRIFI